MCGGQVKVLLLLPILVLLSVVVLRLWSIAEDHERRLAKLEAWHSQGQEEGK